MTFLPTNEKLNTQNTDSRNKHIINNLTNIKTKSEKEMHHGTANIVPEGQCSGNSWKS